MQHLTMPLVIFSVDGQVLFVALENVAVAIEGKNGNLFFSNKPSLNVAAILDETVSLTVVAGSVRKNLTWYYTSFFSERKKFLSVHPKP